MAEINIEKFAHNVAEKAMQELRDNGIFINRWIPVSEALPEENRTVIASTKDGYGVYPEAKYTKEYGWEWAYEAGADYWRKLEDVIAWMPLPAPYKAESAEPKMGRWIDDKCSICGKGTEDLISGREWYRNEEPNFCPFCGIKIEPQESEVKDGKYDI